MLLKACFQSGKKGAVDFCFDRSQVITFLLRHDQGVILEIDNPPIIF